MNPEFEGLNLIQLLDLLEPVPEPEPISLMPQTQGWIWLGLAIVILVGFIAWKWYRFRRDNAYRQAGLLALHDAGDDPAAIAKALRRTALAAFPRGRVAGLKGRDWLEFLDSTFATPSKGKGFVDGPGQVLTTAPYRRTDPEPGLKTLAVKWVLTHHRPKPAQNQPAQTPTADKESEA